MLNSIKTKHRTTTPLETKHQPARIQVRSDRFGPLPFLVALLITLATASSGAALDCGPFSSPSAYVDALNGSDVTGDGSQAAPWKTITHASRRSGGCLVVGPGVYDGPTNGESFPLYLGSGVTVTAQTAGTAIVRTGGADGFIPESFEGHSCSNIEGLVIEGAPLSALPSGVGILGRHCEMDGRFANNEIRGFVAAIYLPMRMFAYPGTPVWGGPTVETNFIHDNSVGVDVTLRGYDIRSNDDIFAEPYIVNNVFADNDVGLSLSFESFTSGNFYSGGSVENNTFAGNRSDALQISQTADVDGAPRIANNIFAFSGGYGIRDESIDPVMSSNDFWMNSAGDVLVGTNLEPNNLFLDPLLVDRANADYHLDVASPCIDSGTDSGAPDTDIDGTARPLDGDGDLVATTDIGAYESPAVMSLVDLRRADFSTLAPDKANVFPFDSSNPRTPVVVISFASGDSDPTTDILTDPLIPLAFYQLDPAPNAVLFMVADPAGDTVTVTLK